MKKALTATLVGALVIGAAVPAFSQDKSLGLSIRAGVVFPTNQDVKDASDAWVGVGVDYRIAHLGPGSTLALSLDYAGKASNRDVPITLNYIWRDHQFYAFAGAGIGFLTDNDESITSFAYEGGVGWDFGNRDSGTPLFIEAKYIGSSDQNLGGLGVYLGVRF